MVKTQVADNDLQLYANGDNVMAVGIYQRVPRHEGDSSAEKYIPLVKDGDKLFYAYNNRLQDQD